jgi:hypothetical protein
MTYRINKTDGNQLVDIPDGTFDTSSTSLTLIGKNVTSFGEAVNENLVKLLENFASTSFPEQALKGQLWYDTGSGRLNVYDGVSFRAAGGPVLSRTIPTDLVAGDLWLNNETKQLWFYDGTQLTLAGPIYSTAQGVSGTTVETILDNFNRSHTIVLLKVAGTLLGIFSKDKFIPAQPIIGFDTGDTIRQIQIGFNVSLHPDTKFDVIVTRAENILTDTGELKSANQLVYNDDDQVIVGSLILQSNSGLIIGAAEDVALKILPSNKFVIEQQITGQNFGIRSKTPTGTREFITIDATSSRIGFLTDTPQADVDIQGNLRVAGDLLIGGDTVTIQATELVVEDKNIILGSTAATPTNTSADGGGITLKGTTDKTFNWYNTTGSWTSSENIDIIAGNSYKINTLTVLSENTLGASVLTSSLVTLGNLTDLQMSGGVTALYINNDTIQNSSGDIVFNPILGNVSISNKKLVDLGTPIANTDAAPKGYVDAAVFNRGISMSMDITGLSNTDIENILNNIAPFYNGSNTGVAINGTILRLHGSETVVTVNPSIFTPTEDVGAGGVFSRVNVRNVTDDGSESVIADFTTGPITIPAPVATVTVTRVNKSFEMVTSAWQYQADF